ncbi:rhodanese-like domain-containing protein [Enterococcus rivorum]
MVLIAILVGFGVNELYLRIMAKRSAKTLVEEEFKEGMRKAQVIDVREKDSFDAGHILGARSMPYSMLKTTMSSIRKDKPVYIYDQKKALSIRTANKLRKNGYKDLYILKGGYEGWTGKTKKKNM